MLDRTRCVIEKRLGTDPVDPNTSFQEGDVLQWSATGWVKSANGTLAVIRGLAGINKVTSPLNGVVINLRVVFTAPGAAVVLPHGNVIVGTERIVNPALAVGAITVDYNLVANGIITQIPGSVVLVPGAVNLMSFTYQMSQEEMEQEVGMPISNSNDETLGSGNVVVLQGNCTIFTDRFDTTLLWALNDPVYDNGDGLLTNVIGMGPNVWMGTVKKVPTASDSFLGVEMNI